MKSVIKKVTQQNAHHENQARYLVSKLNKRLYTLTVNNSGESSIGQNSSMMKCPLSSFSSLGGVEKNEGSAVLRRNFFQNAF